VEIEENKKRDTSFHIMWGSFLIGFFLGIVGVAFSLFAVTDRRDKIYSSLFGFGIGTLVTMMLLKYGGADLLPPGK
jgi:purine-cytosine permease-like protein